MDSTLDWASYQSLPWVIEQNTELVGEPGYSTARASGYEPPPETGYWSASLPDALREYVKNDLQPDVIVGLNSGYWVRTQGLGRCNISA